MLNQGYLRFRASEKNTERNELHSITPLSSLYTRNWPFRDYDLTERERTCRKTSVRSKSRSSKLLSIDWCLSFEQQKLSNKCTARGFRFTPNFDRRDFCLSFAVNDILLRDNPRCIIYKLMSVIILHDTHDTQKVLDFVSVLLDVFESWKIQNEYLGTSFFCKMLSGFLPSLRVALDTRKGSVIGRKGRPVDGDEGSRDAVRSSRPSEKGRKRPAGLRKSKDGWSRHRRLLRVPWPRAALYGRYFRIPGEPTPTAGNREQSDVTRNIVCAFISKSY